MKKLKLFRAMSDIDDKFIEEANPEKEQKSKSKTTRFRVLVGIAACFCCAIVALNLWLFLPLQDKRPDLSKYKDSEYYAIIVKLNEVTYRPTRYKNNFDKYIGSVFGAKSDSIDDSADTESATMGSIEDGMGYSGYEEVTDNQVSGVIEGDLFKRSDKYIYYLNNDALEVYSIDGEASTLVGTYSLTNADDVKYRYNYPEMYLSNDCNTVTLIYSYYTTDNKSCVAFEALDVSDPADIVQKHRVSVMGHYLSSRFTNGKLLAMTRFYVGYNTDFSEEKNFIPQIDTGDGYKSIPIDDIVSPEKLNSAQYTVIFTLDGDTLSLSDSEAFLSYSDEAYVSADNIYVTRKYTETAESDGICTSWQMSDISRMPYSADGFGDVSTMTVEGYIKDQYSLDEYEGLLRIVTTTDIYKQTQKQASDEQRGEVMIETLWVNRGDTNANLYALDFESTQIRAQVIAFAPPNEVVQSVRFDGAFAYVCTSIELSDPVFFFDLSDIDNITVKDTGTIDGFSTSLVNMGNGYLLGIGIGASRSTLKIEVYKETEDGVSPVCKYESKNKSYSTDYKSYYINRENGLIGLGITVNYNDKDYNSSTASRYLLLHFDGHVLHELINTPLSGEDHQKRGVEIDGYMYMLGDEGLKVKKIG